MAVVNMPGVGGGENRREAIVAAVWDAICDGRLPPGSKLGEDELARIFEVSRTIVRDALKELAFRGIAEILPQRGAFVARPTVKDADDVYAARRVIEAAIIEDVAKNCTANDIRALRAHIELQAAARKRRDKREFVHLSGDFHLQIARLGGNRMLAELLEGLVARAAIITTLYLPDGHACVVDEHTRMVDLLAAGKAKECIALMKAHLQTNMHAHHFVEEAPQRVDLTAALSPKTAKTRA
jgi:DNA-binding GntR family transcriptional regulator